ncbi:MAG: proton-conducting transporter membrane subunit [Pseudomonadota bacterium]
MTLLAPFGWAIVVPFLWRIWGRRGGRLAVLLPSALFVFYASRLASGKTWTERYAWAPALDIEMALHFDGLSGTYLLLITGIGALIALFAVPYEIPARHVGGFDSLMVGFMGAMQGLVLADDLLTLFVFWELTSITSYLLIGFDSEKREARAAARQALLITSTTAMAMLFGFLLLGELAGTRRISELHEHADAIVASPSYPGILILIAIGAFAKSAIAPFHFWLPNAMTAPTPVSAYLHSATMVKAGIYLLARLRPTLSGSDLWFFLLGTASVATLLVGAVRVVNEFDLKRVLAETTVIGLGALLLVLAIPTPYGVRAFAVFLVVHALYKAALFMIAGAVQHSTHTRNLRELSGLWKAMPVTSVAAVLSGVAMMGMPPMLGFIGKELIYDATLDAPRFSLLWVTAAFTGNAAMVAGALLVVHHVFFGRRLPATEIAREPPPGMLVGPCVLGLLSLVFGIFHDPIQNVVVEPSLRALTGTPLAEHEIELWGGISTALVLSIATVAAGVTGYVERDRLIRLTRLVPGIFRRRLENGYRLILDAIAWTAHAQTRVIQNGRLPIYGAVFVGVAASALFVSVVGGPGFSRAVHEGHTFVDVASSAAIVLGVGVAVSARARFSAALGVSLAGFGLGILVALLGATDVALAQFGAESLLLIAVVLATRRTAARYGPARRSSGTFLALRAALASLLGAGAALALLRATQAPFEDELSNHFIANTVEVARGHNVVDAILVDFRVLDTLGEITVILILALSLWPLHRKTARRTEESDTRSPS